MRRSARRPGRRPASRRVWIVAAFVAAAIPAPFAIAKAPKPADVPTVEEIYREAMQAVADKARADAEKARDPDREAIEAYRDRKVRYDEYQRLVDLVNNAKDDRAQPYRLDAARALVERFSRENVDDPMVRATRREIALKLLDLMKAPQKDTTGLLAIELILVNWWQRYLQTEVKFKPNDPVAARQKAHNKMKSYLKKSAD